jgi:ATPase subunit of ABC transporter with duplicated ATPase domains
MSHRREFFKVMIEDVVETNKETTLTSWNEIQKAMSKGATKAHENKELRQKFQENSKKGQNFATRFRDRLMNVLTDAQLDKMQKIMDESPDFVKRMLQEGKQRKVAMAKSDEYRPGPDSWRPGDGTPAEFKRERQQRKFPVPKNE